MSDFENRVIELLEKIEKNTATSDLAKYLEGADDIENQDILNTERGQDFQGYVEHEANQDLPDIPIGEKTEDYSTGKLRRGIRIEDTRVADWSKGNIREIIVDGCIIEVRINYVGFDIYTNAAFALACPVAGSKVMIGADDHKPWM